MDTPIKTQHPVVSNHFHPYIPIQSSRTSSETVSSASSPSDDETLDTLLRGGPNSPQKNPQETPLTGPGQKSDIPLAHFFAPIEQANWSVENLPEILYVLRPGTEYSKSRARVRQIDLDGLGTINHFPVLPNRLPPDVEGWRLEAWARLDRRITAKDIVDRIDAEITTDEIDRRRKKFRNDFHIACWGSQRSTHQIYRRLKDIGVDPALNTTRGLTPGLIDPSKGEDGGRVPLPEGYATPAVQSPVAEQVEDTQSPYNSERSSPEPEEASIMPDPYENVPEYELAIYAGPPACVFEGESIEQDLTLDEYLAKNSLAYEDWLCRA